VSDRQDWINDVRDRLGDGYVSVAYAMLNGSVEDVKDAEDAMHQMQKAGLLEVTFADSGDTPDETWTFRYALPKRYR
jgi:hypothetical protein